MLYPWSVSKVSLFDLIRQKAAGFLSLSLFLVFTQTDLLVIYFIFFSLIITNYWWKLILIDGISVPEIWVRTSLMDPYRQIRFLQIWQLCMAQFQEYIYLCYLSALPVYFVNLSIILSPAFNNWWAQWLIEQRTYWKYSCQLFKPSSASEIVSILKFSSLFCCLMVPHLIV